MATKPEIDPRVYQSAPVIRKAADHKTIYANVIRTGITPFDVRIIFGQVAEITPGDPVVQQVDDLATVIMSAEEAKAMILIVQQAVDGYESMYGEIRNLTPLLEKMKAEALARLSAAEIPPTAEAPRKPKKN